MEMTNEKKTRSQEVIIEEIKKEIRKYEEESAESKQENEDNSWYKIGTIFEDWNIARNLKNVDIEIRLEAEKLSEKEIRDEIVETALEVSRKLEEIEISKKAAENGENIELNRGKTEFIKKEIELNEVRMSELEKVLEERKREEKKFMNWKTL